MDYLSIRLSEYLCYVTSELLFIPCHESVNLTFLTLCFYNSAVYCNKRFPFYVAITFSDVGFPNDKALA
jgi:hypothetical protein